MVKDILDLSHEQIENRTRKKEENKDRKDEKKEKTAK